MKQLRKDLGVFIIKLVTYSLLSYTFFNIFARTNIALTNLSRTLVITGTVYIVFFAIMYTIYGGLAIGKEKTRPIVVNLSLSTIITTLITYIFLMIMNTNPNNNLSFQFDDLHLLFITLIIQFLIINIAARFGNYFFFKNSKPASVTIINNESIVFDSVKRHLNSYAKEYSLEKVINFNGTTKLSELKDADTLILLDLPSETIRELVYFAYESNKKIIFNAQISDVLIPTRYEIFEDILMVSSDFKNISIAQLLGKRIIDILASLVGIILSLPILLIVGIAIKLDDGGPVFFKQTRITRNNTTFDVYKLRSMKIDASLDPAKKNDDRITKVGHIIRKLRIDEVPQFFNVLKGDMSLVGPRPDNTFINKQIVDDLPEYEYRVKVKGGLTGYAQIYGRYNTHPSQKLILDLEYINNYSVWKDIKLIFLTLTVFFKKDSAEGFD